MSSDEQRLELEPLIEACRPHAEVPSPHIRRTVEAILWHHQDGAKWRALPFEFGPWWMAAPTFIRWARLGVWQRVLAPVRERGVRFGMVFLGGTNVRAHQKAAGASRKTGSAKERDGREALGRSRGGYGEGLS